MRAPHVGSAPLAALGGRAVRFVASGRGRRVFSAAISFLFLAPVLTAAAPSIAITSPPPGNPLYEVRPTVTVAYSSSGPSLDLDSLVVVVNGADWSSKFTKSPTAATYAVSSEDALIAGDVTVSATISDTDGNVSSTAEAYGVHPTLLTVLPGSGRPGDVVTVEGRGLDPDPSRNIVRFARCVESAFSAVDVLNSRGTVVVPPGALRGSVSLLVNGRMAREQLPFALPAQVTTGNWHSLALAANGRLWAWGDNLSGQLGTGSSQNANPVPTQIDSLSDVVAVDAGNAFTLALTADGTAWSWGNNANGQLGSGGSGNQRAPVPVVGLQDVRAVAAGGWNGYALRCDGSVWS